MRSSRRAGSSAESGSSSSSARPAQKRAADRHPLLLAARQLRRPAVEQGPDPEPGDDLVETDQRLARRGDARAVAQVSRHRKMREQARLLEYTADPPQPRRQVHAARGIEQGGPADGDEARIRPLQPGDHIEQRRLAAAVTRAPRLCA